MRKAVVLFALAMMVAGCRSRKIVGGDDDDTSTCISGLESIALSPASSTVTLTGGAAAPITFVAMGHFADGSDSAIDPTLLTWSAYRVDDTPPGTITAGVLQPFPSAAGTVTVSATDTCVTGATTVRFYLDAVVGTPSDPTAWTGTPDLTGTVAIPVYPSDQTRFPRNIYRTLFQWRTAGHTQFRLTFESAAAKVTIYTDGAHALCTGKTPAAGCWEADETGWSFLAGSNAGGTATWTLDALDTSTVPPTVRRSPPITLAFSRRDVRGAIFYWSTTSAGIRRANVAAAVPEDYITGNPGTVFTTPADEVKCVACHSVSRDGRYIAAPVDATSGKSLWIMEVTAQAPPNPLVKNVPSTTGKGFATFSPNASSVAIGWGGDLWTVDRATGAYGQAISTAPYAATHPDWAPDDTKLVFATGSGDAPANASIAVVPRSLGVWGPPVELVPAAGQSNLFPMFSPDSDWIAYSRGAGGHGDLTAQLWVVSANGGTPVELMNANRVVSNQLGDGQTENNQPTWAPQGDLAWIAFNSLREYGVVSPPGTQQIWVAAIDPAKLATGGIDPSYPAFRLQFQGLNEDNHRAFWTLDVNDPDGPGDPPD